MLRNLTSVCLLLVALLLLSGCWVADIATRNVDVEQAKAQLAQAQQALATIQGVVAQMKEQLAQARAAFEATKSEHAAKVVATFERAAAAAEAQLPLVQGAVNQAQAVVADLEKNAGSSVPLWKVGLAALIPFLPKLLVMIPGVGPALAPFAGAIANGLWSLASTKGQKQDDAAAAAAVVALPHQVAVTHKALGALAEARPEVAREIKQDAKREQEIAGVLDILRPFALQLEQAQRDRAA